MSTPNVVTLRVVTQRAPAVHNSRPTEFGLQDKAKALHPGVARGKHIVFEATLKAVEHPSVPGMTRFSGPFVHGSAPGQHLYIGWRVAGEPNFINRLKVALSIPFADVERAMASGHSLETDGTGPAWGVLKDWHSLGVGRTWHAVGRGVS